MEETKNAYNILVGKPEWKRHLEELGVDGKMIIGWILKKLGGNMWTGFVEISGGPLYIRY
jgi:hypothetical protein